MSKITLDFEVFLKKCDGIKNYHGQEARETFDKAFSPWFGRYKNGDKSLEGNLGGMIKYNLTEEEAFFILAYTRSYSSWINSWICVIMFHQIANVKQLLLRD